MSNDSLVVTIIFSTMIMIIIAVGLWVTLRSENDHHHHPGRPIYGGCESTRWGCCPDRRTPKVDHQGSNCPPPRHDGCEGTRYGCCPHSSRAKKDAKGSNCLPHHHPHHRRDDNEGFQSENAVKSFTQIPPFFSLK